MSKREGMTGAAPGLAKLFQRIFQGKKTLENPYERHYGNPKKLFLITFYFFMYRYDQTCIANMIVKYFVCVWQ